MPTVARTGKTRTEQRRNHGGGYLYVITNPAWPGFVKIGRSTNVTSRHRTYQTASPHRDYQLYYARWFPDVCGAERSLARIYPGHKANGEWHLLHPEDASNLIDRLASKLEQEGINA
jgi:hypothetical protein